MMLNSTIVSYSLYMTNLQPCRYRGLTNRKYKTNIYKS